MGVRAGLNLRWLRESQTGAVTLESALGMGALIMLTTLLIQVVGVVVLQLQLQTIGYEALRIAVASGDISKRVWQAESFVRTQNSAIESQFEISPNHVTMQLELPVPLHLPGLPNRLTYRQQGLLVDRALW